MGHKIQVTFTNEQWQLVKMLKGSMGNSYAEVIRNIVVIWLSEKSFLSSAIKETIKGDEI